MITIEPPYYVVHGITVFRDHADPDLFYALPGTPVLASQGGGPPLALFKWRDDLTLDTTAEPTRARGAGLAFVEVELAGPTPSALATELASQSGRSNARVVPVVFREAVCTTVLAHVEGDKLVQDERAEHVAPIVAPHHVSLALQLTPMGAALLERAMGGEALPVGVVYEMKLLALSPSLHARATMDFDNAYDRFMASIGITYYVRVGLDADIAWLIEHDFIKIDILQFTDAEDAARQRKIVIDLVTARVQSGFFRTVLAPTGDGVAAAPVGGIPITSQFAVLALRAKAEILSEQRTFEMVFDGRTAIELVHTASGVLASLAKDASPPADVQTIDLHDPFFDALDVRIVSAIAFEAIPDLVEVDVELAFRDARKGYVFDAKTPGPFRFQAAIGERTSSDADFDAYTVKTTYSFARAPASIVVAERTSRERVLVVNPARDLAFRRVELVLAPLDPALVARVVVHVRAASKRPGEPDLERADLTLDPTSPRAVWSFHGPIDAGAPRVLVKTDWVDAHEVTHEGDDWVEVASDTYEVLGPYVDVLAVLVQPAVDWASVVAVQAELHYDDGDYHVTRVVTFTRSAQAAIEVDVPLLDASKRTYRWSQTVMYAHGPATQTALADGATTILLVGREPKTTATVKISWLGAPGAALALRVDVWASSAAASDPPTASALLRAGRDSDATIEVPLDERGVPSFRYEVHQIEEQGERLVRSGDGSSTVLVVQSAS